MAKTVVPMHEFCLWILSRVVLLAMLLPPRSWIKVLVDDSKSTPPICGRYENGLDKVNQCQSHASLLLGHTCIFCNELGFTCLLPLKRSLASQRGRKRSCSLWCWSGASIASKVDTGNERVTHER
eukprot:scaffold771_cov177-Alexandrium_tamarense.AAC.1